MKKILFFLVFIGSLLNAKTLVVDDDYTLSGFFYICKHGSSKGGFWGGYYDYSTIEEALSDAENGDTIEICNGQYDESVLIPDNKNGLTLKAAEDDPDVIIKSSDKGISVSQNTKGLTLENIKIFSKKDGVYFNGNAGDVNFTNVVIQNENGYILYTKNPPANSLNIDNSILISKDGGIKFSTNNGVSITDSNITDVSTTIDTSGTLKIQNSEINSTSSKALTFKNSNNPKIDNTTINAEDYGIYLYNINDWQITNTTIHSNSKYAIYADGGNNNFKMDSIHISGNKGAYIHDGSGGKILNSCFTGITNDGLVGSHDQIRVKDNCFINIGGYEANFSGNNLNFNGNYWEDKHWAGGVNDTEPLNSCPNDCDNSSSENLNQCYTDNFDRTELGNRWTIIKEKNYTPQIKSNKLMLTKNGKNIATGVTLSGKFPANNNYIVIEFEHNAYGNGGNGADGITVALADASVVDPLIEGNVSNIAGAYGGSLGYAQRSGIHGFKGGWLGIGLDEFGNYSNPTEGRIGGTGFKKDAIAIRGHWDETDESKGYEYITGTDTLSPGIDANTAQNYKYKISIDTRNSTQKIKIERDIRDGNGYQTIIDWTDINQSDATPPENFKLSFTGSTGGAKNYHSIDFLNISAVNCGTLGEEQNETVKNYKFDAWNDDHNISDRNITTKIVNQDFNLTLAEVNGSAYNDDFNGTVCSVLFDEDTKNKISEWNATHWRSNDNINKTNISFKVTKAVKKAKVYMYWIENVFESNDSCSGLFNHEGNETNSTDNFAIRPKCYNVRITPNPFYAGSGFDINVSTDSKPDEYNGTAKIEANITDTTKTCVHQNAEFNLSNITFDNGESNNTAKFDDVGIVDINITDKTWAEVDNYDTPKHCDEEGNGTYICICQSDINKLKNIKIVPHHFEINATYENYKDGNFTYYDGDLNITSHLDINITTKNEQNKTTENYNKECYAKDIDINLSHNSVDIDVNKILYKYKDSSGVMHGIFSVDKDNDVNITSYSKDNFTTDHNGSVQIDVYLNFDRNISNPVNPFEFNITEINVTDEDNVEGIGKPDSNATFYYGNFGLDDIVTTKNEFNKTFNFIVYDENEDDNLTPNGAKEIKYNWYKNLYHQEKDGNVSNSEIVVSRDYNATNSHRISSSDINVTVIEGSIANGNITFKVKRNNNQNFAVIHLLSPNLKWLWYSKYGDEYNISDDSTCLNHFCFTVTWQNADQTGEVGSGNFNGTKANITDTNSTRRGVKIFR